MDAFRVININRHRIETDGEGVTTLVGLAGCPLDCKYCINYRALHAKSNNWRIMTPEQLLGEVMIDLCYYIATGGGVTFGGGEPLLQAGAIHAFRELLPQDAAINLETSLNVDTAFLRQVAGDVSLFIIDIKDMNPVIYQKYTGCDNIKVLENLKYLCENGLQDRCRIRVPVIPGYENEQNIAETETILRGMGFSDIRVFNYIIKE